MTGTATANGSVPASDRTAREQMSPQPAQAADNPLRLVAELLDGLEARAIRYCLWKSTPRLREALTGRTDLDLLISSEDSDRFDRLMADLGIKPFHSHRERRFPGLEDHIGLDRPTGRLVHLHVHYQLILGEPFIKNHHLPIEGLMLENTEVRQGVRVPVPELELSVLAIRALLKYRDVDWFKDLVGIRTPGLPADTLHELRVLAAMIDPGRLTKLLAEALPYLPPTIVLGIIAVAHENPRDAGQLIRLRRAARVALRPYEREHGIGVRAKYLRARATRQWPVSLLTDRPSRRHEKRKTPAHGGTTVAFVGIDGSGKSAAVSDLVTWLEWRVRVRHYYLGSAQPSRTTRAAGALATGVTRAARATSRFVGSGPRPSRALTYVAEAAMATRFVGEGFDRMRRARAGAAWARAGVVVLFDRYPLPAAVLPGRYVDGPRIRSMAQGRQARLLQALASLEEWAYRRIPPPDHVVVLDVEPGDAIMRKASSDPARLIEKAAAVKELMIASGSAIARIEVRRPLEEVRVDIRAAVWTVL